MKTKIYYVFLLAVLILASCGKSDNVSEPIIIGESGSFNLISFKINGHEYIKYNYGYDFTHSGDCAKCKHELDSIVKNAVNEAIEANNTEYWNE